MSSTTIRTRNHTTAILTMISVLALALTTPAPALAQTTSKSTAKKSESSGSTKTSKLDESKSSRSTKASSTSKSKSSSDAKSDDRDESSKTRQSANSDDSKEAAQYAAANQPIYPQSFNDQMLAELIFDLTNAERIRVGLRPFENNRQLAASATAHSRDMASRNYFNHKSKGIFNRTDPHERMASAGYQTPRMTAENIAMIPTFNSQRIQSYPGYGNRVVEIDYNSYNRMAAYAVKQWMESKGHRENILNRNLTELGIGVAIGIRDNVPYVYLTQNFGG